MIASSAKRGAAALLLATTVATGTLAQAQNSGPIRLVPLAPATEQQPQGSPESQDGIQTQALGAVDVDSIGLLNARNGGLGFDLWAGADRTTVTRLIGLIPTRAASPAMRDLMRRLLLTAATAPNGSNPSGAMAETRIAALLALGDAQGAADLLRQLPPGSGSPVLAQAEVNALFQIGQAPRACGLAAEKMALQDDPFWQKTLVFCQVLAGEPDKAGLSIGLLQETGHRDDAFFMLTDAMIAGNAEPLASLPGATPLHMAMAAAAKLAPPATITDNQDPGVLRMAAENPSLGLLQRVKAAERAEAAGALPTDDLRALYMQVPFSPEDMSNPLSRARDMDGPQSRALMIQAAKSQGIAAARAEVMAEALDVARRGGRHAQAARLYLNLLDELRPTGDLDWFGPEAVRAFLAAGQPDRAARWLLLLRASARTDPQAEQALIDLMPLARLAGGSIGTSWTPADLTRWHGRALSTEQGSDILAGFERGALLFALLEAAGETVPDSYWLDLLAAPPQVMSAPPNTAAWTGLTRATQAKKRGESLLYALILLSEAGPGKASPSVLNKVVAALNTVGLHSEARAVAVEAAIAGGL
ncbi:hypothetical protein [Magnetospira sp. QH-2]|uniref:hypothetical protein n=1 Tax=Magnetospira sp. (strain QH-2) TaxID=1288970 RepID=UPI0003E81915|nr:hypothetical protein [Magnetospira sp. QH-2]CCQ74641.1 putative Antifreeze glycopeptide polyprotein [Magnetospira sp. QH-2]